MHKRKGALANSSALLSLKLCIFFCLFLSFSCPFPVLFLSFLTFFTSFPPFFILFYPFSTFFNSFRLLSLLYSAFTIYLSSLSFLLFLAFIILKPFYSLIYLSIFPFTFHSCLVFALIPLLSLLPLFLSLFISVCSLLSFLCLF